MQVHDPASLRDALQNMDTQTAEHLPPAAAIALSHQPEPAPEIRTIHVALADLSILEWYRRIMRLVLGATLVSVMLSLPALLFYAVVVYGLLSR